MQTSRRHGRLSPGLQDFAALEPPLAGADKFILAMPSISFTLALLLFPLASR